MDCFTKEEYRAKVLIIFKHYFFDLFLYSDKGGWIITIYGMILEIRRSLSVLN